MSLSNCARCGQMFQRTAGSRVCFRCKEEEEQAYRLVRDFLELNPGATTEAVSDGTGVEAAAVLKLLQDGRLALLGDLTSGLGVACERCGGTTTTGRFCADCTETIGAELKDSAQRLLDKPDPAKLRRPLR